MTIKRILVPVDFSPDSLKALSYSRDFGATFRAELLVLHVVEPVYYATPADMYSTSPNLATILDEQLHVAKQQLSRIEADLKKKKGQRARALLKTGSPAQVIADTAKKERADLIVMSTHGRTGLAHIVMGSVAEKVVRSAHCAVLTVRRDAVRKRARTAKKR